MEQATTITVRHAVDKHCYELVDGETAIGKTEYVPASGPDDKERIFYHTEVSEAYAGKGLATVLAKHALDDTIAAGLTIIPVCPYIKGWLRRHPDYQQHTAPILPEHLAAVDRIFTP
ncbi:putative GNAT family acetyltransferase [Arthrobacter globiformis]|uniref:GNAT family N-acetyltransferase n=1 Tax=Arthrobacter globiformis TaxID=1665 RepID=UPI0027856268|nr:GNAT family N-acetyltransferase [Arthrobacter globiformis]MDQ1056360.1 putative GNAT family acetyltransferase [Arthrobacter globiformis]